MLAFWLLAFGSAAIGNTLTWRIDADRHGIAASVSEIATNEFTSMAVSLAMLPFLLRACDCWPLHAETRRRYRETVRAVAAGAEPARARAPAPRLGRRGHTRYNAGPLLRACSSAG